MSDVYIAISPAMDADPDLDAEAELALGLTFLSRWSPGAGVDAHALAVTIGRALGQAVHTARRAWPTLGLADEGFVAYLAERADSSLSPIDALGSLRVSDLFVAYGCAVGDAAALASFEASFFGKLGPSLARLASSAAAVDDLLQELRVRLLIGQRGAGGDEAPKIAQYRGRGSLKSWLEVAAKRLALDQQPSEQKHAGRGPDEIERLAWLPDPELEQLRARYADDFRAVVRSTVREALATFTVEEANLVRWHLVENVPLRKLAQIRGVSVSTVSREFARLRARVLSHVRQALVTRVNLPASEIDSVLAALLSHVSISIGEICRAK